MEEVPRHVFEEDFVHRNVTCWEEQENILHHILGALRVRNQRLNGMILFVCLFVFS